LEKHLFITSNNFLALGKLNDFRKNFLGTLGDALMCDGSRFQLFFMPSHLCSSAFHVPLSLVRPTVMEPPKTLNPSVGELYLRQWWWRRKAAMVSWFPGCTELMDYWGHAPCEHNASLDRFCDSNNNTLARLKRLHMAPALQL